MFIVCTKLAVNEIALELTQLSENYSHCFLIYLCQLFRSAIAGGYKLDSSILPQLYINLHHPQIGDEEKRKAPLKKAADNTLSHEKESEQGK